MNILIISQCNKNALRETRRIVDQFAERTGDRTWQTEITAEGLQTLRGLLRRTARKNTAVACFWMRGRHLTELIWIVGDKKQFNEEGRTPTNRTKRNILRTEDENQWNYLSSIQIMVVLGALLHDLGKATEGFDDKLRNQSLKPDPYRHEWLSLCLFKNMIYDCESNEDFLKRLHDWESHVESHKNWHQNLIIDESDINDFTFGFEKMPPLAQWLAWLIVSHHRMPFYDVSYIEANVRKQLRKNNHEHITSDIKNFFAKLKPVEFWVKNPQTINEGGENLQKFFKLKKDPSSSKQWQKELKRWSKKALNDDYLMSLTATNMLWNPLHLHLSRLCLMVGDHNYSSLDSDSPKRILERERLAKYIDIVKIDKELKTEIWANLDKDNQSGKQFLDEHLVGVSKMAASFARYLPYMRTELNALKNHTPFRKRSTNKRFAWQDKACDIVKPYQEESLKRGFFGINIASTGTGKTLANAKIMTAIAGDNGRSRLTFALGLRVLTSQTGNAIRQHFELNEESIATLIGGPVFTAPSEQKTTKFNGSESSADDLFFEESEFFDALDEGGIDDDIFGTVVRDAKTKQLLMTPWISCTIDHLMQVSEQQRGGRYIAPLLRILSSDLILDEPDDFGTEDLPALSRLIYWCGLLGSRVILSSATITKDMAVGLHKAYEDGRKIWNQFVGLPNTPTLCAWFDEFNQHIRYYNNEEFSEYHQKFCEKRVTKLQEQPTRRKAEWLYFKSIQELGSKLIEGALKLHQLHGQEFKDSSGKNRKISMGLIRFANIDPMMKVLQNFLAEECPKDVMIHVVPYHSQQLLLLRSKLEEILDRLLNRQNPDNQFLQPEIQAAINNIHTDGIKNHIFIVFGSPVTEVGRDHDYDWAIIEPSSMRSIIQLVGRVWRHRPNKIATNENILILSQNIKASRPTKPQSTAIAYTRPGYETPEFKLHKHYLPEVIKKDEIESITSIPRLLKEVPNKRKELIATKKVARKRASILRANSSKDNQADFHTVSNGLADLEHQVMRDLLNNETNFISLYRKENNAAHLSSHHSRISPFRQNTGPQETYVALADDYKQFGLHFKTYINAKKYPHDHENSSMYQFDLKTFSTNKNIKLWLEPDFQEYLDNIAEQLGMTQSEASLKFATVNLTVYQNDTKNWSFNPWAGFWKERSMD